MIKSFKDVPEELSEVYQQKKDQLQEEHDEAFLIGKKLEQLFNKNKDQLLNFDLNNYEEVIKKYHELVQSYSKSLVTSVESVEIFRNLDILIKAIKLVKDEEFPGLKKDHMTWTDITQFVQFTAKDCLLSQKLREKTIAAEEYIKEIQ